MFPAGRYRVKGYCIVTPADFPTTIPVDLVVEANGVTTAVAAARERTENGDVTGTAQNFTFYYAERVGPGPNDWS